MTGVQVQFLFSRSLATLLALLLTISPTLPVLASQRVSQPLPDALEGDAREAEAKTEFTLTQAENPKDDTPEVKVAAGEAISAERIHELVKRFAPLPERKTKEFRLPEQSLIKPPLPGTTALEPFPPKIVNIVKPEAAVVEAKRRPLAIDRVNPEGPVSDVEEVSVTFNQPMVALSEAKAVDPKDFLKLSPQPEGQWEWAGAQTLLFHPSSENKRLAKATNYTLVIPKGVKSVNGSQIESDQKYEFGTPVLGVTSSFPRENTPLPDMPPMLLIFDQDMDRKSVLQHLTFKNSAGKPFAVQLVEDSYLKTLPAYWEQVSSLAKNRWLCVRPTEQLPLDTRYTLTVEKGCPSAEGPELTISPSAHQFFVHGPMRIVTGPTNPVHPERGTADLHFTNPIGGNEEKILSLVKLSPPIPDCTFTVTGDRIFVQGQFLPYHKYTVTVGGGLPDIFGQTLGRTETRTFVTGSRWTELKLDHQFHTIAPGQEPVVKLFAKATPQVDVRISRVTPDDWLAYRHAAWPQMPTPEIGSEVLHKSYPVGQNSTYINCDLKPFLTDGHGMFVIYAECWDDGHKYRHQATSWVQVTELGLDAFKGKDLMTLVTKLASGEPVRGASVKLLNGLSGAAVQSNASGQATLDSAKISSFDGVQAAVGSLGTDTVLLPEENNWLYTEPAPTIRWYCVTDRSLYKPGQTVHVKGWQRGFLFDKHSAIEHFNTHLRKVSYVATGLDDTVLGKGVANIDAAGGFTFDVPLPQKINLSNVRVKITADASGIAQLQNNSVKPDRIGQETAIKDYSTEVDISVEEYRRPEFEMKTKASQSSCLLGETIKLTALGTYFGGGALPHANVNWSVQAMPWDFNPPNWPGYQFTNSNRPRIGRLNDSQYQPQTVIKNIDGLSDSTGQNSVNLTVNKLEVPQPYLMRCEATIMDVNRQQWSDRTVVVVHPAKTYVGLKLKEQPLEGKPLQCYVVAADIDGKVHAGRPVTVRLMGRDDEGATKLIETRELVSAAEPTELSFKLPEGNNFHLTTTTRDADGKINETALHTWVPSPQPLSAKGITQLKLSLKADKTDYQPGDVAEVTVSSSNYPCYGLAAISRQTMVSTIPLDLKSGPQVLKIPISEYDYPNFLLEARVSGNDNSCGYTSANIYVPPRAKSMALAITPARNELAPGSDTSLSISLKDFKGAPVAGGHVAIAVVDEALLALRNFDWYDPLNNFYPNFGAATAAGSSRNTIFLPLPEDLRHKEAVKHNSIKFRRGSFRDTNMFQVEPTVLDERHYSSGRAERHQTTSSSLAQLNSVARYTFFSAASGRAIPSRSLLLKSGELPKFTERIDFSELALFAPDVVTDAHGNATVPMHLPDNTTKYKIMAVAVSGIDKYAAAKSQISTKMDLSIKPSLPRFLNFGDSCELPFVVQNQTDKPVVAEIIMRAQNALLAGRTSPSPEAVGKRISLAAHDRVEVRFPIATYEEGKVDVQCAVTAGSAADAANVSIPVYVPASMETFATYGQVDKGAVLQKVTCPKDVFTRVGGLTVTTSSTALQALTDAYVYLEKYPYSCSEQLSVKLLSMLALHDTLAAFNCLPGDMDSKYRANAQEIIEILETRQQEFGGFGLWTRDELVQHPYASVQVAQALLLATAKDFKVTPGVLTKCKTYLKDIESFIPSGYDLNTKLAIRAKALNARYYTGDVDAAEAKTILLQLLQQNSFVSDADTYKAARNIPMDCVCWLLPVLSKAKDSSSEVTLLRRLINNSIKETASTASSNSADYGDCNYLLYYSPRRADALMLLALIEDQPQNELIAKLAKGLLAHKKNGAWDGTQENCAALLALDKYFAVYEKDTPNFEAQEWLGDHLLGLQKFIGRSTESKEINIPMDFVQQAKSNEILINKSGPGRLYYRLGLDYAFKNLNLAPKSLGFTVKRHYEAVDNKDDVTQDSSGVWHIKAGATVRYKVTCGNIGVRYHVALMAPLPAGCEPINNSLAGSKSRPEESIVSPYTRRGERHTRGLNWRYGRPWSWNWYEHQNMRDHQAEAFASLLNAGEHDYSFMMRATTPGRFIVPPAKAEEMYSSETFGRSASEIVLVE